MVGMQPEPCPKRHRLSIGYKNKLFFSNTISNRGGVL